MSYLSFTEENSKLSSSSSQVSHESGMSPSFILHLLTLLFRITHSELPKKSFFLTAVPDHSPILDWTSKPSVLLGDSKIVNYRLLTLSAPSVAKGKIQQKSSNFRFVKFSKQIAPFESTGREVSFEWSHHRILCTDLKVRTPLREFIIHSGSERVNN